MHFSPQKYMLHINDVIIEVGEGGGQSKSDIAGGVSRKAQNCMMSLKYSPLRHSLYDFLISHLHPPPPHLHPKIASLWGGGGFQTRPLKTKPIFRNVRPMHFTLWYFTMANLGVKNWFHPANNSSYEVCSCYLREGSKRKKCKNMVFDHTLLTPPPPPLPEAHLWSPYCDLKKQTNKKLQEM